MAAGQTIQPNRDRRSIAAGIFLGMGFAGFFDGIVLHQILQWHHMLTTVRPIASIRDLEANTLWDGLFHVGAFVLTAIGLILLWRSRSLAAQDTSSRQPLASSLMGAILIGAGSFNVIEGVVDHHLLQIHHVKPGPNQAAWDVGFLVLGVLLAIVGWLILQHSQKTALLKSDMP